MKKKIAASYERVKSVLWEIEKWAQFWSPLHKIEVLYDDGAHQDFSMIINWQIKIATVRTIRFLDSKENIVFFSPIPPLPMRVHQGEWQLKRENGGSIELIAIRWFELVSIEEESVGAYERRVKEFSDGFTSRLEKLLTSLGELCEKLM